MPSPCVVVEVLSPSTQDIDLREKLLAYRLIESQPPGWLDGQKKNTALRKASLLALPSYQENFGVCVMESLATGVPVLISPHVNLAEEIKAAGAGWIAPVEKKALEAALMEALNNKEERDKRGRAGRNLSLRFSWKTVAMQLQHLYTTICENSEHSA